MITIIMDLEYSPEINQEVFRLFANGLSNQDIRQALPHLTAETLKSIIEISIELVIGEIQNLFSTKFSLKKDSEYDKRREQVIREMSGSKRMIFSGANANNLGENSLNHFLKICKHYMRFGNLNNYNYNIIHKLFKGWLDPPKNASLDCTSPHSELARKKRHKEKLQIEHDILIKKSQIISIQEEIQALEQALRSKDRQCKLEEESQHTDHLIEGQQLEPVIYNQPIKQASPEHQTFTKEQSRTLQAVEQGVRQDEKGRIQLKWKQQQEQFFIELLQKYTIRDQSSLLTEMQQRFGAQKFSPYTLRDKKYEMLRVTRERCLIAMRTKDFFKEDEFRAFANHFLTIDNIQAFKFISKFLNKYYFRKFQSLSPFELKQIISEVYQQKTRVLSRVHTSKIINQLIAMSPTQMIKKQSKVKSDLPLNSVSKKGKKAKSQF